MVKTGLQRYRREEDDHDHDHEGDHEDDHEDNTENETGSACDFCTFSNFCFISKALDKNLETYKTTMAITMIMTTIMMMMITEVRLNQMISQPRKSGVMLF